MTTPELFLLVSNRPALTLKRYKNRVWVTSSFERGSVSFGPSTSVPFDKLRGPTLRTNGGERDKLNNLNEISSLSVHPERSCEAAKSKDRMV